MILIKGFLMLLFLSGVVCAGELEDDRPVYRATVDRDGIQRVEITGGEYYYKPDYIIIKKDIPVELIIKRERSIIPVPHNIVIDEPEAGISMRESMSADPRVIKFTPKKTGKFIFYCDKKLLFFKSHREQGMEGILEVVK